MPRPLRKQIAALLPLVLLGCANTAASVKPRDPEPSASEGLIIGRFGYPAAIQKGALERRLQVTRLSDQKSWWIPFREQDSDDHGETAPFYARLPSGAYRVTSWTLLGMYRTESSDAPSVVFTVSPGQVTCLGSIYMLNRGANGHPMAPQNSGWVALLPRDECAVIEAGFHQVAPQIRAPVVIRLAVDPGCPTCRADPDRLDRRRGPLPPGRH
jgi:hypothetical protein